jgi:AraC-like DNA-binding protein
MKEGVRATELGLHLSRARRGAEHDASSKPSRDELASLAERCGYRLDELTAACNLSPRRMRHSFRAWLACTPREFLREERLKAARRLLQSATSVKEVAYTLGFPQESQFSRDFKARFGVSPSALKALLQHTDVPSHGCEDGRAEPCRGGAFEARSVYAASHSSICLRAS